MANTTKEMTVFRVPLADGTAQEYEIVDASARAGLQNKQNTLTFDSTPTANSTNPITSGGVYTAISNISPSSEDSSNNSTIEMEWVNVYSQWQAGYYYDPDNNYAYTQIPSTETTWSETPTYTSTSCTPYSELIPVKAGEKYRYQNPPIHFDSKNAEVPSVIIFDSNKAEIQAYTRTYQDEWTEFTIPTNGVWMAVLYYNNQTYYLQKKEIAENKFDILIDIYSNYRTYTNSAPPVTKTLTKGYICMGTDDLRRDQTKSLHELYTNNNIPYYIAAIPEAVKACVSDDPYKTNLDYMKMCVASGGEIICHNAEQITNDNVENFDFINKYFRENKKELEFYGFTVNGIYKAGGDGYIYGRDKRIDAWATMYYEYGDLFGYAYPYLKDRVILEYVGQSQIDDLVEEVCVNHGFAIVTTHDASDSATMYSYLMQKLGQYTRGTDYDFCTPSQLYSMLMPDLPISGGGGSAVDTNTTYSLSMASNIITLTGSDSSTSNVTLPIYDGSSDSSTSPVFNSSGLSGKNVIFFGDSIGEGTGNNNHSFVDIINERGVCASVIKECHASATVGPYEPWSDANGYDCISMITARASDIPNADIVFCEYGGNDTYSVEQGLITIGSPTDASTVNSVCGYVRRAIENIRTLNPTVEIVWLVPFTNDFAPVDVASYVTSDLRIAITKAITTVCASMLVTYYGLYDDFNPIKGGGHLVNDLAAHPSEAGHVIIADRIIYGYPYYSLLYRPLRIITLTSSGTYDSNFFNLLQMVQQNVDVIITYNGLIFRPEQYNNTSIIFKSVSADTTTTTEYILSITSSATALYSITQALTSVPWDSSGGDESDSSDNEPTPTPSSNYETVFEGNVDIQPEPNTEGAGYSYLSSLTNVTIEDNSQWRITVDSTTNVITASYVPELGTIGIVFGNEMAFYNSSNAWIIYYPARNTGSISLKVEKAVTI